MQHGMSNCDFMFQLAILCHHYPYIAVLTEDFPKYATEFETKKRRSGMLSSACTCFSSCFSVPGMSCMCQTSAPATREKRSSLGQFSVTLELIFEGKSEAHNQKIYINKHVKKQGDGCLNVGSKEG